MRRLVVMGVVVALAASCSSEPPDARPSDSFASIEELAAELREPGLCEEFIDKSHRTKTFEFGTCWPPGADRGTADFILLARFPEHSEYQKHRRWDSTGCSRPMIYGRNWNIGPVRRGEADEVLETVGGEVVGWTEKDNC